MKCIKTVKQTKERAIGEYVRTTDKDAETKVSSGYWSYVPKSEWKKYFGKTKKTETEQVESKPKSNKK